MSKSRIVFIGLVVFLLYAMPVETRAQNVKRVGGKPDLNGIWQALNSAAWDIQDHSGALGIVRRIRWIPLRLANGRSVTLPGGKTLESGGSNPQK
jgi:hypothetical protein